MVYKSNSLLKSTSRKSTTHNTSKNELSALQRSIQQNENLKTQIIGLQKHLLDAKEENTKLKQDIKNLTNISDPNKNIVFLLNEEKSKNLKLTDQNVKLNDQNSKLLRRIKDIEIERDRSDSGLSDSNFENETTHSKSTTKKTSSKSNNSRNIQNKYSDINVDVLLTSLAREKLKTAAFDEQVNNLQSMINSKNLASQKLLEEELIELTEAKEKNLQYELRLIKFMKEFANMHEKIEVLETANETLQSEIETIGEYITVYRQQRSALKQMQYTENQKLIEQDNEKEEMRIKLEYLALLVKKLLGDRTMLYQDQRDLNTEEIKTTEQIVDVIDDVIENNNIESEPIQILLPYYGPQWDV